MSTAEFISKAEATEDPNERFRLIFAAFRVMDQSRLATKEDLKDLEIKLLDRLNGIQKEMNNQIWKIFGVQAVIVGLFGWLTRH